MLELGCLGLPDNKEWEVLKLGCWGLPYDRVEGVKVGVLGPARQQRTEGV